MSLHGTKKNSN
jgi:hypothetical protein